MLINWNYLYKSIVDHKDYIDCDFNPEEYPLFLLRDSLIEESKLNQILEDFRRINMIRFFRKDHDQAIKFLTLVKDLRFKVSDYHFNISNLKDVEALTNPEYFNESVDSISCLLKGF